MDKGTTKLGDLRLNFLIFEDQIEPKGFLVYDKACHACWYYFMLAHKNWLEVGTGIESQVIVVDDALETPLWMELRFHNIAKAVALIYGLDSPEDFLPYAPLVEKEADRLHKLKNQPFEMPAQIWSPFMVGKLTRGTGVILQ